MDTKLSLVNVCRLWRAVATRILYEDVAFRRWKQIESFRKTIDTVPAYRRLVKTISVHVFLPETSDHRASISPCVEEIITKCPLLTDLRVLAKMPLTLGTLRSLWPTITHLSFELLPPDPLHLIKLTQQTLVSLSITVSFHNLNRRKFDPIHLPNLRSLSLLSLDWRSHLQDSVKPLLDALKVKSLQSLALGLDAPPPPLISMLASFLDLNGRNLRSLSIRIGALDKWESIPIENLLIKCPTLERLAIWPGRPYILSHPELKWLDIGPWFYRDREN
ncbi:hypothetical protein H0H93_016906, partial [Arthromyces matolae]